MARGSGGILGVGLRGSVGGVTFSRSGDLLQVRERVRPRDPKTPLQMTSRARMDDVAALWAGLDDEAHAAWVRYAAVAGAAHAWGAFLGLTSKWMMMYPQAPWEGRTPPQLPPPGPFYGDNVVVSILPSPERTLGRGGQGERTSTPNPLLQDEPLGGGGLRVVATQANAAGVATEILVQRLPNARRKARAKDWKGAGFVAFAAGGLAAEVPLPVGAYAVAYRFVNVDSGAQTLPTPIGTATVGAVLS